MLNTIFKHAHFNEIDKKNTDEIAFNQKSAKVQKPNSAGGF